MRRRHSAIELKSPAQIAKMRSAGLVVAEGLAAMAVAAVAGATTYDLDQIGRGVLDAHGATSNFLGFHGSLYFPGVICASVNDEIVHGIPDRDRVLADGDLISIDFGAILDGWNGDAAVTVEVGTVTGEATALSVACEKSLWDGLATALVGARLSDISHAVETSVRTSGDYGIVENYGGHGIGTAMHMDPHILNYGRPGRGPELVPGMALAVEPMITAGSPHTSELDDQWTVVTADHSLASHWEHTVALLADGPRAELGARGVKLSALAD
jgi:methionyl aminopeptidase